MPADYDGVKLNDLHWPYPENMLECGYSFAVLRDDAFDAVEAAVLQTNGIMLSGDEGWGVQFQTEADFMMFKLILDWHPA